MTYTHRTPPRERCNQPTDNTPENPSQGCPPLDPGPETPKLPELPKCPEPCCCPTKPGSTDTCLDGLIDDQTKQITEAERAKSFKADLEDLLKKAKAAKQDYTRKKYQDLREIWEKQDGWIADLIAKVECCVPCWWCLIECEVCPLLYSIRDTELRLNGDGKLTDQVYSLRDLRYWQERNRDARRDVFDRVKVVFAAWEKPAQTLEKILADNGKLIEDSKKNLATDAGGVVLDVFLRLIPMHWEIAPAGTASKIAQKYQAFCDCDKGKPDNCCGFDVGVLPVRQRLFAPQPYLVDPDKFFDIICCLAKERYLPAKDLLAQAEAEFAKTEAEIKRAQADLEQKKKSWATDFKNNVVSPIDCNKYRRKDSSDCGPPADGARSAQSSAWTVR